MNTSLNEPPTTELHQQRPAIQKASEPADAVVADEVSFAKKHRRLLLATGLAGGGLAVALMAGGSKPTTTDPRLLSPRAGAFAAQAAGTTRRTTHALVAA